MSEIFANGCSHTDPNTAGAGCGDLLKTFNTLILMLIVGDGSM